MYIFVYILYNCVCDSLCMLNSFSLPIIYLQIDVSIKNVMSHFFQEGETHVPYFLNPSSNTAYHFISFNSGEQPALDTSYERSLYSYQQQNVMYLFIQTNLSINT